MLHDYEISACSKVCHASGLELKPGDAFYSALLIEEGVTVRRDVAAAEWQGPPEGAIAWWRAEVRSAEDSAPQLAPTDVLLNLFGNLAEQPGEASFRYVLGLLLIRRRLLKITATRAEPSGEVLLLDCPRRREQYELQSMELSPEEAEQLDRRLVELVYSEG